MIDFQKSSDEYILSKFPQKPILCRYYPFISVENIPKKYINYIKLDEDYTIVPVGIYKDFMDSIIIKENNAES